MKVKKSDLKRILNELVPPQVRAASQQKVELQTTVSKQTSSGGVFFVSPTMELETMEMKFEPTGTPWYEIFYNVVAEKIPYFEPFIENNEIVIPEALEEKIEGKLAQQVNGWSKSFLYKNNKLMSLKDAMIDDDAKSITISILGTYKMIGEDGSTGSPNAHTVILDEDVDKMVKATMAFLTEPISESDLKNVELIMGFLAGDQKAQAQIFGTNESYFDGVKQALAQTANKYFGTEFDTSDFEKTRGYRLLCSSGRQQTDQLYDSVEYFNQLFSEMSGRHFDSIMSKYNSGFITDTVTGYVDTLTSKDNLADQFASNYSNIKSQIAACDDVLTEANKYKNTWKPGSNEVGFLRAIKLNANALDAIKRNFENAAFSANSQGFNKASTPAPITFTPTTLDLNESKVQKRKDLLAEVLSTNDIRSIFTDWFDKIFEAQQTGGLAGIAATSGKGIMQFFLAPENIETPISEKEIELSGDLSKEIANFFATMASKYLFDIEELSLDDSPSGAFGKKLLIKDVEDFAFFIKLDDGSYLNPFDKKFDYDPTMRVELSGILNAQQVDGYEILGRTRPLEGGEEPSAEEPTAVEVSEREQINSPNYDANVKGLVRQLEKIVNAYNDSIKETDKMTVDGRWESSEDSAWGKMVTHAMGDAGKSPAKGSRVTVTSISNDWKQAGKDLVRQGLKGYTNNAAGALAFAYDSYTNGEDVKNGHKRPVSSRRRPASSTPSTSTEPAQKTSGLPKRSANDIKVSLVGNLKGNKGASDIVERIKSQMKMHVPESVSKEIKIVVQTKAGGAPRFQSRSDINSQLRQPDELIRFIKTTIKGLQNTKGVINIVIPKGVYTLNESPAQELVALIQELVKQK